MAYLETMAIKTTLKFIKDLLQQLQRQKMLKKVLSHPVKMK
jgi:hypothetical protein